MGDNQGFLKYPRQQISKMTVEERICHFKEYEIPLPNSTLQQQVSRCMDCGVPFCHWGCPVGTVIPELNELLYRGHQAEAMELLERSNPLAEITGRLCPALCEEACVLGLSEGPVTIRQIERQIVEGAFDSGLLNPQVPTFRTGKRIAIIGSGPTGLAAAFQLNRWGHTLTVFEADSQPGGLLRYGIPDFKLDKSILERRINQMRAEGVIFETGVRVGRDISVADLKQNFHSALLAIGTARSRDIDIPGRNLRGIHLAMEYLSQINRQIAGELNPSVDLITAENKRVVVIGGGDTGADCASTAIRQHAKSVLQIELLPKPPTCRNTDNPWPHYARVLREAGCHEEGCERDWSVKTIAFDGDQGSVTTLRCIRLRWAKCPDGTPSTTEIKGSEFTLEADLVLIAAGFLGPETRGLIERLGLQLTPANTVATDESYRTNIPSIYAAGDMRRGQSLVVWAIQEGLQAAATIDRDLKNSSA